MVPLVLGEELILSTYQFLYWCWLSGAVRLTFQRETSTNCEQAQTLRWIHPKYKAMWWFGHSFISGKRSQRDSRYARMFFVYSSACLGDVRYDVAHRIAVARNIVLSTIFCRRLSSSISAHAAHNWTRETGMSNSMLDLHWLAFGFPCTGDPKLAGGPVCHPGRIVEAISFRIW